MRVSTSASPSRSWTLAAWTMPRSRKPSVSTSTCRLRPLIFLPASKPRGPPLSAGLHRLAVDDPRGRLRLATGRLPCPHQQGVVQAEQGAVPPPAPEIAENRALGWKARGQERPLAAGAQQVEDRVQYCPQIGGARPAEPAGRRQPRLDQGKLGVTQVGCVALGRAPILDTGGESVHMAASPRFTHETDTTTD